MNHSVWRRSLKRFRRKMCSSCWYVYRRCKICLLLSVSSGTLIFRIAANLYPFRTPIHADQDNSAYEVNAGDDLCGLSDPPGDCYVRPGCHLESYNIMLKLVLLPFWSLRFILPFRGWNKHESRIEGRAFHRLREVDPHTNHVQLLSPPPRNGCCQRWVLMCHFSCVNCCVVLISYRRMNENAYWLGVCLWINGTLTLTVTKPWTSSTIKMINYMA